MIQTVAQGRWEVFSLEAETGMEEENKEDRAEKVTALFSAYSDEILRLCFLYLRDYQLAEDALQETYLRAYRFYDSFEERAERKTWLIRIAINVCKTMLSHKRQDEISYEDAECKENLLYQEAELSVEALIEKNVLSKAIMSLKKELREVILLYYYEELKLREIAKLLDIPMTTAVYRQQKGKKELKKILEKEEKGGFGL